jgi:N-acetylglucosaminyl-diphospho-decaprenol L-rhamnosyltransferase
MPNEPASLSPAPSDSSALLEVVVVTFNSWSVAEEELTHMCRLAGAVPRVHWTFVDNTPSAGDLAALQPLLGETVAVSLMALDNPGFAAACNRAVESTAASWVLLLNPDVLIGEGDLRAIVGALTDPDLNATTLALSMVTGGRRHAGIALAPYKWFVDAAYPTTRRLIGPSGGAAIYKRSVFLQHGGFWERLFAWGEDADLAWRLSKSGERCAVLDLRLRHQGGHSISRSLSGLRRKVHLLYRNRVLVARRNLSVSDYRRFIGFYLLTWTLLLPRNAARRCVMASWRGMIEGLAEARRVDPASQPHVTLSGARP